MRKGQHILKCMTDLDAKELELKTRELFTECLVSLGAVKRTWMCSPSRARTSNIWWANDYQVENQEFSFP